MKKLSTTIKSGDNITFRGMAAKVGNYYKGEGIKISIEQTKTSVYSIYLSTFQVNKLIKEGAIIQIKN